MSKVKQTASSQNKMGTMPIMPLIINMSLPMMVAMLVQALYNVVDSIFVAKLGEDALTAVSLAFPVQNLMISFGVGTAIGVATLMSTRLGEGKQTSVDRYAMNGIFLALCTYIVFAVLGVLFLRKYLQSQTSSESIVDFGEQYLSICLNVGIGLFASVMLDRLLQATGRTSLSMIAQMIGAVFNIIFDPLLIFGLGPFPRMGIAGAAWATVIGQVLGAVGSLYLNLKHNPDVHYKWSGIIPVPHAIKHIYIIAVPSILLSSITSVVVYFFNIILGFFSTTAIAVYGVYFKLQSFIFMPVFGLNNGIIPIVAYNYGARHKQRIHDTIKGALIIAEIIMATGALIFELFPKQLFGFFNASPDMLKIGVPCFRIIAISFFGAAVGITCGAVLQAFGSAVLSATISFMRQAVVLLPSAYLLSRTGDVNNVWWSLPIAEIMSFSLSIIFLRSVWRKKVAILVESSKK